MSDYKPGTVARITMTRKAGDAKPQTFDRCIWDALNGEWVSGTSGRLYPDESMWDLDIHPLVVLDLDDLHGCWAEKRDPAVIVGHLRETNYVAAHLIADQIEAQTKPPRIPEPGLWGVVEAAFDNGKVRTSWVHHYSGWYRGADETPRMWSDLIDPTLVREGLS